MHHKLQVRKFFFAKKLTKLNFKYIRIRASIRRYSAKKVTKGMYKYLIGKHFRGSEEQRGGREPTPLV